MKMTIGKKMGLIVGVTIVLGLAPFATVGWLSYHKAKTSLRNQAFQGLVAVREIKKDRIEDYFVDLSKNLVMVANDPSVLTALTAFNSSFEAEGNKVKTPSWNNLADTYGPRLKRIRDDYGWYDLFLIHTDGEIVYTVAGESDLGMVILEGELKNTGIGQAYTLCQRATAGETTFGDFTPYPPSNNQPSAFMMTPICEGKTVKGYVALQVPLEHINEIMKTREGMGETGETILIGPDFLMRSDSFLDKNFTVEASFANPAQGSVKSEAVKKGLDGESGETSFMSFTKKLIYVAYGPVKVGGLRWVIEAKINEEEADLPVDLLRSQILTVGLVVLLFVIAAICVVVVISRSLTSLLKTLISDLDVASEQLAAASQQISSSSQQLSDGATRQAASLEETSSAMEEMSGQTRENAANCAEAAKAIGTVAGLAKSSASLARDAADLSTEARRAAENGVAAMSDISQSMKEIHSSSDKVTEIIEVISEITHQTKMLATNAAIEAARAGDQGKGFAVVADEVSKLAEHSKNAAKEIASLIKDSARMAKVGSELADKGDHALRSILEKADQVASLVRDISGTSTSQAESVTHVEHLIETISTASAEQASGAAEINHSLVDLDSVTQSNAATAEEAASSAEELTSQAGMLRELVAQLSIHVNGTSAVEIKSHPMAPSQPRGSSYGSGHHGAALISGRVKPSQAISMREDFKDF